MELKKGFDTLFQQVVAEHFPDADLLPFDTKDGVETRVAVAKHETGDTLFDFVFHELADVESQAEAVDRLQKAQRQLQVCIDAIYNTGTV